MKWTATRRELNQISKVVDRYLAWGEKNAAPSQIKKFELVMNLEACHSNGNPLDFDLMLDPERFRDLDVIHDVAGIAANLDKTTGKLLNCFSPRATKRSEP